MKSAVRKRLGAILLVLPLSLSVPALPSGLSANHAVITVEAHGSHHHYAGGCHKKKAKYVCITRTGKCYHTHKCGNGTYYKVKLKKAKTLGLRKCKKCYG